ncbi:thioredoxin family protein [Sulfitobacter sp. D35]|uniref:thioredoxin family protein n=1 Tax=Sulfitobacter sp. D35 TaxID=3083252 RepID=UPI00296F86A4|nr:thioredoxin family protein [Sulfitobacter sp. D35]MDW4498438.1 thioredoxin family protein [Sulfitobacter sp. D35]
MFATGFAIAAGRAAAEVAIGDDGLYEQPFFLDSFLEMGPDLDDAAAEGKGLIVIFEQRGCPYCRELHEVNFARPELRKHIEEHFVVVQLDMWGSRGVTDFDGEELEERALARKWQVNFTPTQIVIPAANAGAGKLRDAEAFRLPGYFKPFHHLSGLEYVTSGAWREQPFQRFLQDKFAELQAQGIDPDVW